MGTIINPDDPTQKFVNPLDEIPPADPDSDDLPSYGTVTREELVGSDDPETQAAVLTRLAELTFSGVPTQESVDEFKSLLQDVLEAWRDNAF